jgi:hypothetical protein
MIRPEDAEMNEIAEKGKEAVCDWSNWLVGFSNKKLCMIENWWF